MNPSSDPTAGGLPMADAPRPDSPTNWREALCTLVSTRFSIFQYESQQALTGCVKKGLLFVFAGLFLLFAWALMLAGGIAALSISQSWPWYWVALIAGGIHLFIALLLLNAGKSGQIDNFSLTKAEFKKDRAWIENLK